MTISLGLLLYLMMKTNHFWEYVGLVLIVSSGFSNLIDRLFLDGGVRDFIYWPILNVYGNMADLLLVIGMGIVGVEYLVLTKRT
jgi:lipoprotein signal peptidase